MYYGFRSRSLTCYIDLSNQADGDRCAKATNTYSNYLPQASLFVVLERFRMVIGHKLVNVARDEAIKTVLPPRETDYPRNWAGMRGRDWDT